MKLSRRDLLISTAALAGAGTVGGDAQAGSVPAASAGTHALRTLNGQSLAWKMVDGAKQFHLRAGAFEHEFAPGCRAKCWGYNGTTPGPTLEAVEGDRVRVLVTNELPEPTSVHWHGILLPNGMDGVSGLNQAEIAPGETWAYEFTLRQHGTYMYHPHADEMTQMAFGMMGMFIVHPRAPTQPRVDRDFTFLLHNWSLRPGTYRPDPSIMTDFNLWTFNSRVYPGIDPLVSASASAYASGSATCRCTTTRFTCTGTASGSRDRMAVAGPRLCGAPRSPKSSASDRRAISSSSPITRATGRCTVTWRTTR